MSVRRNGEMGWRTFKAPAKPVEAAKPQPPSSEKESIVADEPTPQEPNKSLEAAQQAKPVRVGKTLTPPSNAPQLKTPPLPPRASGPANVAKMLSPAARQQAAKQVVINDAFGHDVAFSMAFIGAGQGGGRMADAFYNLGYRRVAVFNTTESDFHGINEAIPKFSLDIGGAAKDAAWAKAQLKGRTEEIWDLLTRAWGNTIDYGMVCVGLGGGSGSGTASSLVQIARKYLESKGRPPRVGAIVSLPPVSEGQQVAKNAVNAFKELLHLKVSPLIIVDNARIQDVYRPAMSKLYGTANELVSSLLHLFNTLAAAKSEHVTFDRSELGQLLDGGIVVMGSADIEIGRVESPADISTCIREQFEDSVLAQVDPRTGKKGACIFVADSTVLDTYSREYFDAGFTQLDRTIGQESGGDTVIHPGVYPGDPESQQGLQCYTMISELAPPHQRLSELAKKAGLDPQSTPATMAKFLGVD